MASQQEASNLEDDDGQELVSEFPPPPYHYVHAETLTPPPIPHDALIRSSKKSIENRKMLKMMEDENDEKRFGLVEGGGLSLEGMGMNEEHKISGDVLGGDVPDFEKKKESESADGPLITVFGPECYVEDPMMVPIEDECQDPQKIKSQVRQLNKETLQGFITLLGDLVNQPLSHKKGLFMLMKNIELMLKECNKFREHQAREILIETLETQLNERHDALKEIHDQINRADVELDKLKCMDTGGTMKMEE